MYDRNILVEQADPELWAAILAENVGHEDQRITRSSITGLADVLMAAPSAAPAIILYGPLLEDA